MNLRGFFNGLGAVGKALIITRIFEAKSRVHQGIDKVENDNHLTSEAFDSLRNKINKEFDSLIEKVNQI